MDRQLLYSIFILMGLFNVVKNYNYWSAYVRWQSGLRGPTFSQVFHGDSSDVFSPEKMAGAGAYHEPAEDQPNVKISKMSILVDGRDPVVVDITAPPEEQKDLRVTMKEGTIYRIKITFRVRREVATGLRYHHVILQNGVRAEKATFMIGSYGPNADPQSCILPEEEAPKGMTYRGLYSIKSKVLDDDKNTLASWEWKLDVTKDWP